MTHVSEVTAGGPVWLDLSRLLWRALRGHLTGIDRVELAYAEGLLADVPERLSFVALNPAGRFVFLPRRGAADLVHGLSAVWQDGAWAKMRGMAARLFAASLVLPGVSRPPSGRAVYLLVSHRHLNKEKTLARMLRRTGAAFVPLIHDLIPIENPEYGRPEEEARHLKRIATVSRLADAVIVNSVATGNSLSRYLKPGVPSLVALLGVPAMVPRQEERVPSPPYFLCVGTIEPRKNHLMLLNLWRILAAKLGAATPKLILVGKRGWENENILDMLERCRAISPYVEERGGVSDDELAVLMEGARAVLMPSFAEGYGLPVAEALAHGVPVLCSDLPALREVGQTVPEYFGPMDAVSWEAAITAYLPEGSARRAAQIGRLGSWSRPKWEEHIRLALEFIARFGTAPDPLAVAASPVRVRQGLPVTVMAAAD